MTTAISPQGLSIGVSYIVTQPDGHTETRVRLACHELHNWFALRKATTRVSDILTLVPSITSHTRLPGGQVDMHAFPFTVDANGDIW